MEEGSEIKVLIVEDDPIIALDLEGYMRDFGYTPYEALHSAENAVKFLTENSPDLVLLDIRVDGQMDGIDLANLIREHYSIPLIYITAHHDRETINRVKKTRPDAYLVKPINENGLRTSIEVALHNFFHGKEDSQTALTYSEEIASSDHFFIKVKGNWVKLMIEDLLWVEAFDNYSFIHTSKKKFIHSSTLKKVEERLTPHGFYRVHRSYLVNLQKVTRVEVESSILHIGEHEIPIGKTYKSGLMEQITAL